MKTRFVVVALVTVLLLGLVLFLGLFFGLRSGDAHTYRRAAVATDAGPCSIVGRYPHCALSQLCMTHNCCCPRVQVQPLQLTSMDSQSLISLQKEEILITPRLLPCLTSFSAVAHTRQHSRQRFFGYMSNENKSFLSSSFKKTFIEISSSFSLKCCRFKAPQKTVISYDSVVNVCGISVPTCTLSHLIVLDSVLDVSVMRADLVCTLNTEGLFSLVTETQNFLRNTQVVCGKMCLRESVIATLTWYMHCDTVTCHLPFCCTGTSSNKEDQRWMLPLQPCFVWDS